MAKESPSRTLPKKAALDFCRRYLSRLRTSEAKASIPKPDGGTKTKNSTG